MPKDDLVYIGHMLDTARQVIAKVHGISRAEYDNDENLRLALTHLIQIIGEASCHVSELLRGMRPEVPWRAIVGMRHKVVHDYLNVDEDVVWQTATEEMPLLAEQLEAILRKNKEGS
jgi:uncharacterized protein with HEPN domain